jgi:hypothetical protein
LGGAQTPMELTKYYHCLFLVTMVILQIAGLTRGNFLASYDDIQSQIAIALDFRSANY